MAGKDDGAFNDWRLHDAIPRFAVEDTQTTKMVRHYGHLAIILKRDKNSTSNRMPLKMRPTGLGSGAYKDNVDYNVVSGEWLIGRIYERNGFPDEVRFFWSLHGVVLTRPQGIHTDGHISLERCQTMIIRSNSTICSLRLSS